MATNTLLLYLATWALVALTPGPAVMCSMAQSVRHGFMSSLAGVAGIQVGNVLFFIAISLGLGALLGTATSAFVVLRLLGAVYLFYLGVRIIVSSIRRAAPGAPGIIPAMPPSRPRLFLQGLLIQLTNPKALLFVSALLPQFIDPNRSFWPQLTLLALVTVSVDVAVLGAYSFLASKGIESVRGSRAAQWFERAFGAALVFFGIRLLNTQK